MSEQDTANNVSGLNSHEILKKLTGLEIFQKAMAGELLNAPFADTLNYKLIEVEKGRVVFGSTPSVKFSNPLGTMHGGYMATLLDSAMACAVHTTLGAPGSGRYASHGVGADAGSAGCRTGQCLRSARRRSHEAPG